MRAKDIKIDLEDLKKFKARNAKDRIDFIKYWAKYIREHSDKEWSKQQNVVIDSQIR